MNRIWKHILVCVFAMIFIGYWWWHDYGSWFIIRTEFIEEYTSEACFRNMNDDKIDPDMFTWYPFFSEQDFCYNAEDKRIYDYFISKGIVFDFSAYTYILSFGFTIEELYGKGNLEVGEHTARIVQGINCSPNAILLYRAPKSYIYPSSDRKSNYHNRIKK